MKKIFVPFNELNTHQLYDLLQLRQQVFVIEQNCAYDDFDGYDKAATHLLLYNKNKLAAYSRIFEPGIKYENESSIGRIVVEKSYRGSDTGKNLIQDSIDYCHQNYPSSKIRIEAQSALINYYKRYGFTPTGKNYIVDGINHTQMVL